jgi:tRNA threonylcarbamoyladenosine dehydratase
MTLVNDDFLARTTLLLGDEDMAVLQHRTVLVAGCGGVGGHALITLARLGIGGFVLADPGVFDPPDLNRQWAATRSTLGRNKAEVYAELLHDLDPAMRVITCPQGVTAENLDSLVMQADLVVDGLDFGLPLPLRLRFYERVRQAGRWCVSSPIFGFGTLLFVAAPDGMGMGRLIQHFVSVASERSTLPTGVGTCFFPEHLAAMERHIGARRIPSCAIAPNFSAGVQAAEIALILLRHRHPAWREPLRLPHLLAVEPLGLAFRRVHYRELFPEAGPEVEL